MVPRVLIPGHLQLWEVREGCGTRGSRCPQTRARAHSRLRPGVLGPMAIGGGAAGTRLQRAILAPALLPSQLTLSGAGLQSEA